MKSAAGLLHTTIGKKIVMAVSGILLAGFVIAHMLGNLHLFEGVEEINAYGVFLREVGSPMAPRGALLWANRIALILALIAHVWSWLTLRAKSSDARRHGYGEFDRKVFSKVSLLMGWAGVFILLFVVYHILHMTTGTAHPDFVHGDVYHNLVVGLSSWPVALVYVLAALSVGLHLYHGLWSATQTLGMSYPRWEHWRRPLSIAIAAAVALGFALVPLVIVTGMVR